MWPFKKKPEKPKWRVRPGYYVNWVLEEKDWTGWKMVSAFEKVEDAEKVLKYVLEHN